MIQNKKSPQKPKGKGILYSKWAPRFLIAGLVLLGVTMINLQAHINKGSHKLEDKPHKTPSSMLLDIVALKTNTKEKGENISPSKKLEANQTSERVNQTIRKNVRPAPADDKISKNNISKTKGLSKKNSKLTKTQPKKKSILARITVYWAHGAGTDKWSSKNISSTGTRLICGQHAAVDPRVIPYGSHIKIAEGSKKLQVKAVDTGGHVKARKAAIALGKTPAQKNAPVIDVFFQKKCAAIAYANTHPHFQWVEITMPN